MVQVKQEMLGQFTINMLYYQKNRVLRYQLYNKLKPYGMQHYEDKNINSTTTKMVTTQHLQKKMY